MHCTESCSQKKVPDFIAIDGEGVGRGRDHKYVLHCKACGEEVRYDPETNAYFHRVTGYPELETLAREVTE